MQEMLRTSVEISFGTLPLFTLANILSYINVLFQSEQLSWESLENWRK